MTTRYFHPDLLDDSDQIELPETEVNHAVRVMRVQPGDIMEIFDGLGNCQSAEVESVDRRKLKLCAVSSVRKDDRMPDRKVVMAIALPKPDRAKDLIERLTELGVDRVVPLISERVQRPPSENLLEKLKRNVIESCKQCGRNRLMVIDSVVKIRDWYESTSQPSNTYCKLILHPQDADDSFKEIQANRFSGRMPIAMTIGPEGGFNEDEVRMGVSQGFVPVSLGRLIYRIETAAVVSATLAIHQFERTDDSKAEI